MTFKLLEFCEITTFNIGFLK